MKTYPNEYDATTWATRFRTSFSKYDWMRVLYTWNTVCERDALTICTIAACVGRHPKKVLKELYEYHRKHPERLSHFLCGTTLLPVVHLRYDHGIMDWRNAHDIMDWEGGNDDLTAWNPMAHDLSLFHIAHYWPKLKTDAAKRGYAPYYEYIAECNEYQDEDDMIIQEDEWKWLKYAAKTKNLTNYTIKAFEKAVS